MQVSRFFQTYLKTSKPIYLCNRSQSKYIYIANFGLWHCKFVQKIFILTIHTHCPKHKIVLFLEMLCCHLQTSEWREMHCFLSIPNRMCGSIFVYLPWNAVALHALLRWAGWGLTAQLRTTNSNLWYNYEIWIHIIVHVWERRGV